VKSLFGSTELNGYSYDPKLYVDLAVDDKTDEPNK